VVDAGAPALPGEVYRGEGGLQLPPKGGAGPPAQETGGGDTLPPGSKVSHSLQLPPEGGAKPPAQETGGGDTFPPGNKVSINLVRS
jgi:hypothetical protein